MGMHSALGLELELGLNSCVLTSCLIDCLGASRLACWLACLLPGLRVLCAVGRVGRAAAAAHAPQRQWPQPWPWLVAAPGRWQHSRIGRVVGGEWVVCVGGGCSPWGGSGARIH